jgi:hypothetical protein
MKGARAREEAGSAADVCRNPEIIGIDVPFLDAERALVLCRA